MITPAQARSEFAAAESAKNLAKEAALEKFIDAQIRLKYRGGNGWLLLDLPIKTRVLLLQKVAQKYVKAGWLWEPTEGDGVFVQEISLRPPREHAKP